MLTDIKCYGSTSATVNHQWQLKLAAVDINVSALTHHIWLQNILSESRCGRTKPTLMG